MPGSFGRLELSQGIETWLRAVFACNQYIDVQAPWSLRIENEFVRTLIQHNALVAPPDAGPAWPFRLRVRVLGGFELARDGEPMRFTGKAQQRPLDLLKLVAGLGGRDIDSQQATAALWPDADGEEATVRR